MLDEAMIVRLENAIRSLVTARGTPVTDGARKLINDALEEVTVVASYARYAKGATDLTQYYRERADQAAIDLESMRRELAEAGKDLAKAQAARNAATLECQQVREEMHHYRNLVRNHGIESASGRLRAWSDWVHLTLETAQPDDSLQAEENARREISHRLASARAHEKRLRHIEESRQAHEERLKRLESQNAAKGPAVVVDQKTVDAIVEPLADDASQRVGRWQRWLVECFPEAKQWFAIPIEDIQLSEKNAMSDVSHRVRDLREKVGALEESRKGLAERLERIEESRREQEERLKRLEDKMSENAGKLAKVRGIVG